MIIGLDSFGDTDMSVFETLNIVNSLYRLELSDCIIDEVLIKDATPEVMNSTKEMWDYNTLLLGRFQESLEAGNIDNQSMPIENILLRKRRRDSLEWVNIKVFPFNPDEKIYEYLDRIVQATEEYEYAIVPLTASVYGTPVVDMIECEFDYTWVVDKDISYKLITNVEYGDIENVLPTGIIETFSRFPTTTYSGDTEYMKGSITAMVVTDNAIDTGVLNYRQERLNREQMISFFNNRKPKVLKDSAGRYYMISILGGIRESPFNQLSQGVSNITFEWVQIGDIDNLERWEFS